MTAPRYASPPAFKHALEQRLRDPALTGRNEARWSPTLWAWAD